MPKPSKKPVKSNAKKTAVKPKPIKALPPTRRQAMKNRFQSYVARRPHRSFKLTTRRDYIRSLELPGYWGFTLSVWKLLWAHKRLFGGLVGVYAVLYAAFVGLASQDLYNQLGQLISTNDGIFSGGWGTLGKGALVVVSGMLGSFNPQLSQAQQMYGFILGLLTWLTAVWLLRAVVAGKTPRLRDGLYNAGSPIVATGLLFLVWVLQLLPAAIAVLGISVAISTDLFSSGLLSMTVTLAAALLLIISVYWSISTLMALIIVTLPGMYPWQALRAAGDIVIGRRMRLLFRALWLALSIIVIWLVIVLPIVGLDSLVKSVIPALNWLPLVPLAILLVSSFVVVWSSAYVYLLYRKVVEDNADPA